MSCSTFTRTCAKMLMVATAMAEAPAAARCATSTASACCSGSSAAGGRYRNAMLPTGLLALLREWRRVGRRERVLHVDAWLFLGQHYLKPLSTALGQSEDEAAHVLYGPTHQVPVLVRALFGGVALARARQARRASTCNITSGSRCGASPASAAVAGTLVLLRTCCSCRAGFVSAPPKRGRQHEVRSWCFGGSGVVGGWCERADCTGRQ